MANKSEGQPKKQLEVMCRPACESDTQDVLELTRTIWDGDDYVPHVWAEWLGDPHGLLAVAEHRGRVIGLGKLTRLTEVDWWLEGLRVHPGFEGRGVATQLHHYLLEYWNKNGEGTLRLATSYERVQVHRLCKRTGFVKIAERTYYKAGVLSGEKHEFHPVRYDDLDDALAWTRNYPSPEFNSGLIDLGWQWSAPHDELIKMAVNEGRAYWWKSEKEKHTGLAFFWRDDWEVNQPERGMIPTAQFFSCPAKDFPSYLLDFRRLGHELGCQNVAWLAPLNPEIMCTLENAGYSREWEGSLYLFAKDKPDNG